MGYKISQLPESELRYKYLFESMAQGVIYQDKTGAIIDANAAAIKMLGLSLDQLCGKTSYDPNWKAIQEDGSDFLAENHPSMVTLKTGFPVKDTIMGVFNTNENNYRWIRINAFPIFSGSSKEPTQVFTTFDDITENITNKQAQNELYAKYKSIKETTNVAFAEVNNKGAYTFVNAAWEQLFEFRSDEALGKTTALILPSNSTLNYFDEVKNKKLKFYKQLRKYITKTGKVVWCNLFVNTVYNDQGDLISILGIMIDVTESKRNEHELIEKEQRYRSLVEESPHAIFINCENSIVLLNKKFMALMGATHEEELLGKSPFEIFHPSYHEIIKERINSIKKSGNAAPVEEKIITLNGSVIDVEVYASIFEMDGKKAIHVILNDISDRKKTELELKESEEKFYKIFQSSPNAILLSRLSDYKILNVNASIHTITGYTSEDLIGKKQSQFNIWKSEDDRKFFTDQMVKNGSVKDFEAEFIHKSGEIRIWRTSGEIIEIRGEKFVLGIIEDVTELRVAEIDLKESEEKFFKIFQSSPNSIILTRLSNFEIVNANQATLNITGYALSDLIGKIQSEFDVWKSADERILFGQQLAKNGKVKDFEADFVTKSGEDRIWKTSGEIVQINNEKYILGIIEDVTELRLTELELKRQVEFINTMTENQPSGIVACDADGNLVLFNKSAKEWHGIDVLKIPQEQWAENYGLYAEDGKTMLEMHDIPLIKAFNREKVTNYEIVVKAVGKTPRLVSCNGASFFDQKGVRMGAVVVMNDITNQRLIENNLKQSEKLTRKALAEVERSEFLLNEAGRIAKIGAWEFDLATLKTQWSDQVFELHGLPKGEVPDFDFIMSCYVDGSEEILRNAIEECINQKKRYELELRFENARKEKLWVRAIGYPVVNEKDEIISLRGVVQDITETKEYLQKIKESENRYKTLFENQPTIIWEEDFSDLKQQFDKLKDKGVEDFNTYFEEHPEVVKELAAMVKVVEVNSTGIEILEAASKEDIVKNIPYYFNSEEAWSKFKDELVALAHGEVSFKCEIPIRTVKGNNKTLFLNLVVPPDYINNLKKVLVTFQDITELKKIQSEILNTKELLETITNNLPGAVIQYKIKADGSDTLTYVSSGSNDIWGIKPEDAIRDNEQIWNQIDKNYINKVNESLKESSLDLGPWNVEFKSKLPNGENKWIQAIGSPKKNDDGSVILNSIMLDITERKEADESIKTYQDSLKKLTIDLSLTEENQRKQIASNIHDHLSQSLVISKMKLRDFIKKNSPSKDTQELNSVIQHLSDAIQNSRKITYDLSPPILYELGLIETMYWFADKTQKEHSIKVSFITNQENIKLSDKELILIFRTIQELINNTIKHAKATEIFIKFNIQPPFFEISIDDDGIGFNVNSGLNNRNNKSGFGLFSVKERIQNLLGTIEFDSAIGKGTRIKIIFPISPSKLKG